MRSHAGASGRLQRTLLRIDEALRTHLLTVASEKRQPRYATGNPFMGDGKGYALEGAVQHGHVAQANLPLSVRRLRYHLKRRLHTAEIEGIGQLIALDSFQDDAFGAVWLSWQTADQRRARVDRAWGAFFMGNPAARARLVEAYPDLKKVVCRAERQEKKRQAEMGDRMRRASQEASRVVQRSPGTKEAWLEDEGVQSAYIDAIQSGALEERLELATALQSATLSLSLRVNWQAETAPDDHVGCALLAVALVGSDREQARRALMGALWSVSEDARWVAAKSLARGFSSDEGVFRALMAASADPSERVRDAVAEMLWFPPGMGPCPPRLPPGTQLTIQRLSQEPRSRIQEAATRALQRWEGLSVRTIRISSPDVRRAFVTARGPERVAVFGSEDGPAPYTIEEVSELVERRVNRLWGKAELGDDPA